MKTLLVKLCIAAIIALVLLLRYAHAQTSNKGKSDPKKVYEEMRAHAFKISLDELGQPSTIGSHGIYGVIMEFCTQKTVVTLVTFTTGDTSLYFSTGGGVIGGGNHDTVKRASIAFNVTADQFIAEFTKTNNYPSPSSGQIFFYILTKDGIFTAQASENDLMNNRHVLSPLFHAGQNVITEFRLATEKQTKK